MQFTYTVVAAWSNEKFARQNSLKCYLKELLYFMNLYTDCHFVVLDFADNYRCQCIFAVRIEHTDHGGIRQQLNLVGDELVCIPCRSTAATVAILQLGNLDHFLNI
ncbi:hypothetical protein T07_5283 [Trichinella nelsoni]|uniref:Uncharacterized protein n=1 Tax=Trichinella nelsoni TaxID=6336 RepID=A0A0V0S005_9BILA|nr:hypothetical protein T07_5283 [Trichinella nelsoni]